MATKTTKTKSLYNTEIPGDWEVKELGEICKVNQGLQIPIEKRLKVFEPLSKIYITIQYLNNGKEVEYIKEYNQSVCCSEDDILMTRTGNTGIVVSGVSGVFHNNFFKINFDKKFVGGNYLKAYLRANKTQHDILVKAGTSTIPDLNHKDFYKIKIPLPPLPEQRAIARVLSTADAAIQTTEKLIAQKELRKKWLMQQLLTGKKRLPGFEGEWREIKFGSFLKESRIKGNTGAVSKKMTVKLYGKGVHEKEEKAAGSANTQYYIRKYGQFIYSKLDFLNGAFGLIPEKLNNFESTLDLPCFDILGDRVNKFFLLFFVTREEFYKRHDDGAIGGRKAKRIQVNEFLNIKLNSPPLEEQTAIAQVLQAADKEISLLKAKAAKLREQKKGLMQVLLTGKTRLKID